MNDRDLPLSRALGRKHEPKQFSRKEAAAFLTRIGFKISAATLAAYAMRDNASRKGPPFIRTGWRTIRYSEDDLRAWAADKTTRVE